MNSYVLAAALTLTAFGQCCSQTPNKGWGLVKDGMVVMPLSDLQLIHAKRVVANDLLRERAQMVGLQRSIITGLEEQVKLRAKEAANARMETAQAYEEADKAKEANVDLQRKLRRRTPWAVAMKVEVCLVAVAGIVLGVGAAVP